ncbi:hypothetical protein IU469_32225 [Nocardia puris]|uniref:hypothetical protein n=2 Tax=Nocardia puris TaxID=208602 RepID=UPI001894A2CD|nr:hypothetical protein [Nocardia puris]MBF6370337.1 hypothetical protein [Nocardia puris]
MLAASRRAATEVCTCPVTGTMQLSYKGRASPQDQSWSETKKLLIKEFPEEKEQIRYVTKVIGQLAKFDPDGQEFRYASRRDGTDTLSGIDRINLVAFHQAMLGVANYLDATDIGVSEALSTQREMDAYYAEEFDNWDSF